MAMRRPTFDERAVAPHLAFLDELRASGHLEMTGGFSDRTGGAYVLVNLDSLEQAQAIAARDPLATLGTSDLTVHEWNTR
ncbi:YciI family protein [Pseudoxanthomonas sp. Root630]|uniref:YciI family protein n=1 Tax=Pseudoxanthomonas sp. Root630 TaxID=1736574 RepID=UPI000702A9FC|nr:YciI family protein [Pseudoxanthomonas sp. Root630]KRA44613.1 hypothetical protein ASD72_10500 [Pseudoxanthomonas sp. Root630]